MNRRRLSFHCWRSVIWKLYSCKTRQRTSGNGYFEIYCNIRGGPTLPLVNMYKSKLGASTGCLLMIVHVTASTLVRRLEHEVITYAGLVSNRARTERDMSLGNLFRSRPTHCQEGRMDSLTRPPKREREHLYRRASPEMFAKNGDGDVGRSGIYRSSST